MTNNPIRREPTFGEPTNLANNNVNPAQPLDTTAKVEMPKTEAPKSNVAPSLHLNQTPGHTFTPVIKPTVSNLNVSVAEETAKVETAKVDTAKVETAKVEAVKSSAGFAFTPVAENAAKTTASQVNEAVKPAVETAKTATQEAAKVAVNAADRVIPTATQPNAAENTKKEDSSKKRRLGLVALLAAILGAIFFWLKPSTPDSVEELQTPTSGNLPIEFRPVDEAEAQRAEAEAKAQQEAAALAQQQAQQTAQPAVVEGQTPATSAIQQPSDMAQPVAQNEVATNVPANVPVDGQIAMEQPAMEVEKPQTEGSVIHQPETPVRKVEKVEKARPAQQTQKAATTATPKVKAITAEEFNAKKEKNARMDQLVKNVESGKPTKVVAKAAPTANSATATAEANKVANSAVVSSKTMTVPKSTSLMQVFRDNKLNISDVNAMSKVNNIVSNLKENEKITVRLDKNNRVVEMTIGSGGKFTRQADGSYRFK